MQQQANLCPMPVHNSSDLHSDVLNASLKSFREQLLLHSRFNESFYRVMSYILMGLGVFGNSLSLVTLCKGISLQTPHFLFYRRMSLAELLYCANFFASEIVGSLFRKADGLVFSDVVAAYYTCCVARFIYSSVGYSALYLTLVISVDRCVAIYFTEFYRQLKKKEKMKMAVISARLAFFLATVLHSWQGLFDMYIVTDIQKANVTTYVCRNRDGPNYYEWLKHLKDIWNSAVHLLYPIVLLCLTVAVIVGLVRIKHARMSIASTSSQRHMDRMSRERRRERHSIYLMITVAVVAFVQVLPVELKRILRKVATAKNLFQCYGQAEALLLSADDTSYVLNFITAVHWSLALANVATMIDRSLKFYLYIVLNQQIRNVALSVVSRGKFGNDEVTNSVRSQSNCTGTSLPHSSPLPGNTASRDRGTHARFSFSTVFRKASTVSSSGVTQSVRQISRL